MADNHLDVGRTVHGERVVTRVFDCRQLALEKIAQAASAIESRGHQASQ